MAIRYSADFLLHLRDSPLCTRPDNLPPAEEWMGAPPDQLRAQAKAPSDRSRTNDNPLLDQTNRRPPTDRHASRPSANPDDIVFGPPRMAFSSARGNKTLENDKSLRDLDSPGRTGLRSRSGDLDGDRVRDAKGTNLRRPDAEQDSDGWSMVKPRKSFGTEGAERFHGKMGGNFREDRRPARDREDRDGTRDRSTRPFDTFVRDKDAADGEGRPRNGLSRNKLDTWRVGDTPTKDNPAPEKRERDRTRSWRDRDKEHDPSLDDRGSGRAADKRWARDRDHRVERDPEWLDEPQVEQREAHTQQDFQKWMEQMKAAKSGASTAAKPATTGTAEAVVEAASKRPAPSPAVVEAGPDKFFMAFGSSATLDTTSPAEPKDAVSKPKPTGKSSRFTSFFSQPQQQDGRASFEACTSLAGLPIGGPAAASAVAGGGAGTAPASAPEEERQAFQQLLAKLQKQSMSATPPGPSPFAIPQQGIPPLDGGKKNSHTSPELFQPYGGERRDGPSGRPPSQQPHEILAPRPQQQSARPDQLLQDLHQRVSSQGSLRAEPNASRNNSNTEFLMNLMRAVPDAQRAEQQPRIQQLQPQPQKPGPMAPFVEREPEFPGRENRSAQRQMRSQPPPGFPMDESFHNADQELRQNQPTQILQRPPLPPGMDQIPPEWIARGGQMPPPPQPRGPMIPPPGLAGGPTRSMPMPHMFPPNFPPAGMPPPEALGGMPPRSLPMPPPGFFNGPPHGFVPPGLGGFNGPPGPDAHVFGGAPFEGPRIPPPGGRGASYGRP